MKVYKINKSEWHKLYLSDISSKTNLTNRYENHWEHLFNEVQVGDCIKTSFMNEPKSIRLGVIYINDISCFNGSEVIEPETSLSA
jgi:hypothetical protein